MLSLMKAAADHMPRFPHPIQSLVKSDRLDAYRARQTQPVTPMSQRKSKRVRYDRLIRARVDRLWQEFDDARTTANSVAEQYGWASDELIGAQTAATTALSMYGAAKNILENLPRRRRLHNGRLPKLNRGRS
jgi:hypothetical protein